MARVVKKAAAKVKGRRKMKPEAIVDAVAMVKAEKKAEAVAAAVAVAVVVVNAVSAQIAPRRTRANALTPRVKPWHRSWPKRAHLALMQSRKTAHARNVSGARAMPSAANVASVAIAMNEVAANAQTKVSVAKALIGAKPDPTPVVNAVLSAIVHPATTTSQSSIACKLRRVLTPPTKRTT